MPLLNLHIHVKSTEAIQNSVLTIHVHSPLCVHPNEVHIGYVGGSYIRIIDSIR